MSTTAALNLTLFLILVGLFAATFAPSPDPARKASGLWLATAFFVGLASSGLGYLLMGDDGWQHFHRSVFAALAITFAATVLIARSATPPVGPWPIALAGCAGILGPPIVLYALAVILCGLAGGCHMS